MKKLYFLLIVCLLILGINAPVAFGQESPAPVIRELRALIESGKTNFQKDVGVLADIDTASGIGIYKTRKPSPGATTVILQSVEGGKRIYMIRYDTKTMSTDSLIVMNQIVNLYIDELNAMIKSGLYTGSDTTDDYGMAVTIMKDLAGNHILDYKSDKTMQAIYLYGLFSESKQSK